MNRRTLLAFTCAIGLGLPAAAKDKEEPKRSPAELGRVAVVPFLDISGERQEDRSEYRNTALDEVEERLRRYEIKYVPRDELASAMEKLKLRPNDEEDRTKARLQELAKTVGSRYVVTGTIYGADSEIKQRGAFGDSRKTGQAKVQFRVYDAEENRYAEERELTATSTARAKGFSSGIFSRSSKLRVKAVRDATKKAMAEFLKPYPKVHEDDPGD